MKPVLILILFALAVVSQVQIRVQETSNPKSDELFVIPNLVTTTYTSNRRKGHRSHHMQFRLLDDSNHPDPQDTTCSVRWRTTTPVPSDPLRCKDSSMTFSIHNFVGIKDFDLEVRHMYYAECRQCCNGPNKTSSYIATGLGNITKDGIKWKHTRTTSGGTVSAVADEPIYMPIEVMNVCEDPGMKNA